MAKAEKRPPPPSSSEEDSFSDEEKQLTTTTKPVVTQTREESESESESESDSESSEDEDEEVPEPETRPVNNASEKYQPSTSKPTVESESQYDSESESDGDSEPPKLVVPINSRPMAAPAPKDSDAEKSNGKPLFQRIWTLEDEITVLEGMIKFQSERGLIMPSIAGIEDFHAFIQNKLSLEVVSKSQLLDKIKRLKGKYLSAAARAKNGQPHKFQKSHDESSYELGKKIWFSDDENKGRPGAKSDGGVRSSKRNFPFLKAAAESMGTKFAEEKLVKIDQGKAEVLEKRFKKQKLSEMKHHLRGMDLWKETFKLIMEGVERATEMGHNRAYWRTTIGDSADVCIAATRGTPAILHIT